MVDLPPSMKRNAITGGRLSQSVVQDHQRARVLDAATSVFAKRSYPATSVDHLISAAKVSYSTFYELFKGKEDCFLCAYERAVAAADDRISATVPTGGTPAERTLAVLRGVVEEIRADPMAARLVLVEAQVAGPAPVARHEALIKSLAPALTPLRKASPVASELPESFEAATVGGVDWFLKQRVSRGPIEDPEALLGQLAEIVIEPFLGAEETEALLER